MILAGIDEAGYGPLLGPLVVGCCAFRVEGDLEEPWPCVWKRLAKVVGKKRSPSGKKIHVNDSKLVYSPSNGLKELERSILAIAATCGDWPSDLESFLALAGPEILGQMRKYPWYLPPATERFPIEQEAMPVRLFSNALNHQMRQTRAACVHLRARVLLEGQYNQMVAATRNKGSVLFGATAIHLDELLRTFDGEELRIVCDRQGGREHYGSLLRLMFEQWSLQIIEEHEGQCEYRLTRDGRTTRLFFRENAEAQCLPVAVASMLSKYLREALMRRFNAFWAGHLPEISPTAGYYQDGTRFLRDIQLKKTELGISDQMLVRSR